MQKTHAKSEKVYCKKKPDSVRTKLPAVIQGSCFLSARGDAPFLCCSQAGWGSQLRKTQWENKYTSQG